MALTTIRNPGGSTATGVDRTENATFAKEVTAAAINMAANKKITLGDGAGDDYDPGSYEIYENTDLYLKSNAGHIRHQVPAGQSILLEGPTGSLAKFIENGACELYHNDVKRLGTTSLAVDVTGILTVSEGANFGATGALQLTIPSDGGSGYNTIFTNNSSGDFYLRGQELYIQDSGNSNAAWLKCVDGAGVELSHAGTKKFETTTDGVTVTGKLGIGHTSPSSLLDVRNESAAGNYAYFEASSDGGARGLQFSSSDNGAGLGAVHKIDATSGSYGKISLATAGTERLTVASDGKVGIGTTSPAMKFSVVGSNSMVHFGTAATSGGYLGSTGANQAFLSSGSYYDGNWKAVDASACYINMHSGGIRFATDTGKTVGSTFAPTERMLINSGGQVLINTSNNGSNAEPALIVSGRANAAADSGILHIKRGTAAASLSAADALGEITFSALDGGPAAQILAKAWTGWGGTSDCPGNLIFKTAADGGNAPLDRMNIDHEGIIHTTSGPASGVTEMRITNGNMSLADDATHTTTNSPINTAAIVCVSTNKNESGSIVYPTALFFLSYATSTIVKLADPDPTFDVADTDGKMCIYKSSNSGNFTVKNRLGQTNNTSINIIGLRGQ